MAVSYHFFSRSPPVRCPLQRRNYERYSWISAVLMSSIKRYCRELSREHFSLPKIGGICEIPGIKKRARRTSFAAAESTMYIHTHLIQKSYLSLVFNTLACVVNIVIVFGIFSLIEVKNVLQHRLPPGATRSPDAARPRQVPPTQQPQPSRFQAKERASQPNSRRATTFQSCPPGDGK